MRYHVTIAGRSFEVVVDGAAATIDGRRVDAELMQVPDTPVRRLSVNGVSHRIVADPGEGRGTWELHVDGERLRAEVVDERTRAIRAMTNHAAVITGPKPLRAPMPGMIVRVEVQTGDRVSAGQGLVIMEAMKMENELKADVAGTVARVLIAAGTAVEKGAVLIEFSVNG